MRRHLALVISLLLLPFLGQASAPQPGSVHCNSTAQSLSISLQKPFSRSLQTQITRELRQTTAEHVQNALELSVLRITIIVPQEGFLHAGFAAQSFEPLEVRHVPSAPVQPGVTIRRLGRSRGESIAVIEIQALQGGGLHDGCSLLSSAVLHVSFDSPLHRRTNNQPSDALIDVINSEWSSRPSSEQTSLASSVVQKRQDVTDTPLRLATTRDGVAVINIDSVLRLKPSWLGLPTSALHLTLNGVEQYLYVPNNESRVVAGLKVYFVGQHAKGDTTWLSPFSWDNVYYLSIDSTTPTRRYGTRNLVPGSPVVHNILIDQHIEKELNYNQSYFYGDDFNGFLVTDNVAGEKWFWASFNRDSPFDIRLPLVTSNNVNDSLDIGVVYNAINNIPAAKPDKRVQMLLNDKIVYDETFDSCAEKHITTRQSLADLFGSSLNLRCVSLGANTTVPNYSEAQILDYVTIRGNVQAYATESTLDGTLTTLEASQLRVRDFTHSTIVAIDTLQQQAAMATGTANSSIVCRTRNGAQPWTSMTLNGRSELISRIAGLSIVALKSPDYENAIQWSGGASDQAAGTFVRSLPARSLVVMCMNDTRDISSDLRSWLVSQNCTKAGSSLAGMCYCVALLSDGGATVLEQVHSSDARIQDVIGHADGARYEAQVPLGIGKNHIIATSADSIESCAVESTPLTSLKSPNHGADFVVVTHHTLLAQAQRLADYRRSQKQRVEIVDVDDIYREFNNGQKSPHALKSFFSYAFHNWQGQPFRNVLLFGDASWDARRIGVEGIKTDYVPSFGKPVSDMWYTLVDGDDFLPDFCIGRLPVENVKQATNMVSKIIEYDTCRPDLWWKTFLFTSGGLTQDEEHQFLDMGTTGMLPMVYSDDLDFRPRTICGDTAFVSTLFTHTTPSYSPSGEIAKRVNGRGVSWVNYVGHGAPTTTEIKDWDTTTLSNRGRPFVFSALACQNAAFAERAVSCIAEDFLNADGQGAIAAIGSSGYGVPLVQYNVMVDMFIEMAQNKHRRLGEIFTRSDAYLGANPDNIVRGVFLQCCLLGDPLTRIPFDTIAHPVVLPESVSIRDEDGSDFVSEDRDSAIIRFQIFNAGVHPAGAVPIDVVHEFNALSDTIHLVVDDLCFVNALQCSIGIKAASGDHRLRIVLDPENTLHLGDRRDSMYTTIFHVFSPRPLPVDPFPGWNVSATHPRFRFIVPATSINQFAYETQLRHHGTVIDSVVFDANDKLTLDETFTEWLPKTTLIVNDRYTFAARSREQRTGRLSGWLEIPFTACDDTASNNIYIVNDVQHEVGEFNSRGLRLDTSGSQAQLRLSTSLNFQMRSAVGYGYYDSTGTLIIPINPTFQIKLDGVTYGDRDDLRGFNVRLVNRHTGLVRAVRTFDGFFDKDSCDTCYYGSGRTLNKFLRDSVKDDDILFMAICGNTYGDTFVQRDLDTLKMLLKTFGSTLCDSLKAPHSYVFVGMKNRPTFTPFEVLRLDTLTKHSFEDTVSIGGDIRLWPDSGHVRSSIFGPAKSWTSMQWTGDIRDTAASIITRCYGYRSPFSTAQLLREDTVAVMRLDGIDAQTYPYIQCSIDLRRRSTEVDPGVAGFRIDLQPLPECSVVPSYTAIRQDSLLRGDTAAVRAAWKIISPRASYDSTNLTLTYQPQDGIGESGSRVYAVKRPRLDSTMTAADTISTLRFAHTTNELFTIDADKVFPELYRFNNETNVVQHVVDDLVAPEFRFFVDSIEAVDGMSVSRQPLFFAYFTDNSRLPISDAWHLSIRVNTFDMDSAHAASFRFYPSGIVNDISGLPADTRAAITGIPTLEFGTNNVTVSATDYFGNETTKKYIFSVSRDLNAVRSTVVPNPLSESAVIEYTLLSPKQYQRVTMQIYDLRGELVRQLQQFARIGKNHFSFDGRDDSGRELMQGPYYYRLFVSENGTLDSDQGMIVIIR